VAVVLLTIQIKPYRESSSNQLAALSQIKCAARARAQLRASPHHSCACPRSIFLFLFVGLLLHMNPDDLVNSKLLFSVVVGILTISIVVFTVTLFTVQIIRQTIRALYGLENEYETDSEEEEEEALEALEALKEEEDVDAEQPRNSDGSSDGSEPVNVDDAAEQATFTPPPPGLAADDATQPGRSNGMEPPSETEEPAT
jgi:hypothetical protein